MEPTLPQPRGAFLRDADWKPVESNRVLLKQQSLPPIVDPDPPPKKPKKLISSDEDSDGSESDEEVKKISEPEQEPEPDLIESVPNLSFAEREIYFGDRARAAFFDAYRHISRQQNILSGLSAGVRGVDVLSRLGTTTFHDLTEQNDEVMRRSRNRRISNDLDEEPYELFGNSSISGRGKQKQGLESNISSYRKHLGYHTGDDFITKEVDIGLSRTDQLRQIMDNKSVADKQHIDIKNTMQSRLGFDAFRRCDSIMVEKKAQETHLTRPQGGVEAFLRPGSPRTRYLTGCLKYSVAPRPNLIIRKDVTSVLNIEYQYIGDTMAVILANSLEGLPYLTELNVAGNKLTDVGLTALILALPSCPAVNTVSLIYWAT